MRKGFEFTLIDKENGNRPEPGKPEDRDEISDEDLSGAAAREMVRGMAVGDREEINTQKRFRNHEVIERYRQETPNGTENRRARRKRWFGT